MSGSRAYGALDIESPERPRRFAAVDFLREPTLVSERVGSVVLQPVLDLTAVCPQVARLRGLHRHPEQAVGQRPGPAGAAPSSIVRSTSLVSGSIRWRSSPASVFATHTAPAPTATAVGPTPTAIGTPAPESGSIRVTVPVGVVRDPDRVLSGCDSRRPLADGVPHRSGPAVNEFGL